MTPSTKDRAKSSAAGAVEMLLLGFGILMLIWLGGQALEDPQPVSTVEARE